MEYYSFRIPREKVAQNLKVRSYREKLQQKFVRKLARKSSCSKFQLSVISEITDAVRHSVGNKAKVQISKRMFQEKKAHVQVRIRG